MVCAKPVPIPHRVKVATARDRSRFCNRVSTLKRFADGQLNTQSESMMWHFVTPRHLASELAVAFDGESQETG